MNQEINIKLTAEEISFLTSAVYQINQAADKYQDSNQIYLLTNILCAKLLLEWQGSGVKEFRLERPSDF